jgi:anti-anti-sigma factor
MGSTHMDIRTDVTQQVLTFVITGEIDLTTAPRAWETISTAIRETPRPAVTVDMRDLIYIDSAGLALLLDLYHAKPADGMVGLLVSPGSQPDRVLRLGHFNQIFSIVCEPAMANR